MADDEDEEEFDLSGDLPAPPTLAQPVAKSAAPPPPPPQASHPGESC